ncbi:hypothetical protein R75465_07316 [Paraburkholderia aspalathi]|nr:hypothetical protein R75465_07316 [Paraburkholderia aspalathi]
MRALLICAAIMALVACNKDDDVSKKTRGQDNLVPVPASQFRWNK